MTTDPEEDFGAPEEARVPLIAAAMFAAIDFAGAAWRRVRGQREPHIGTLSNDDIDGLPPVTRRER